jgi:hypothetical protein
LTPTFDVVVPTSGRPALGRLLRSLAAAEGPRPGRLIVVDDRPGRGRALEVDSGGLPLEVMRSGGRGPAAARNAGWRRSEAEWVAFLDDDVVCPPRWLEALRADLAGLPREVAASQGRIVVPLPEGRRPTDWERQVKGLEEALWATADIAYRRVALSALGGFEEAFPRAYREDADLALRAQAAGWRLVRGRRWIEHPVPAPPGLAGLRRQAGNADDALMLRRHGPSWRRRVGGARGRRAQHLATTAALLLGLGAGLTGRRRIALLAAGVWVGSTAEFSWRRIAPGPRTGGEVALMLVTSAVIPPLASWHWLRGLLRYLRPGPRRRWSARAGEPGPPLTGCAGSRFRSESCRTRAGWRVDS